MATSYKKVLQGNESLITDENTASWTSKLIHCVGLDYISEVFLGTKVLEDFKLLKDCKPASVSNWSFDDNCHFCCLRREKVKDHVVALNRQIVESGGKPLLGKDPSNICRLEWQSEEFLNAVLHRKEYKPRIPDPHIPVVACEIVQQMINHIATFYTSNTNCFWDSLQNNEEKDKSFVKTGGFMYAAAPQNLASNKLIMADQDAPLDLSVKKIKEEHVEQDCVLDLSTKKNFDKGHASHLIKRVSIDQTSTHVRDLQSASTLEEFMSKLCLHHQHQIVDALGFLQAEVKSVASSRHSHAPTLTLSDKQATTSCSRLSFEARSEIRRSKRTCFADVRTHDPSVVRTNKKENRQTLDNDVSNVVPEKPVDLGKMGAEGLLSPHRAGIECGKGSRTSKSCFSKKRKSAHLEKKQFLELKSFQQPGTVSVNKSCCTADPTCLPSYTAESDISSMEKRVANKDAVFKPTTVQKTFDVVVPISPRTARKSRQRSFVRQRNRSSNYIINDPDRHCDLVYVRKSIIECQPQSHNRRHPRQNARKSTRGHRYVEEYLELKTVRTLARKCVSEVSGNCPACLQNVQNTITPKQSLTKPDSVPLIETPSPGVCMKDAVVQNLSSEQMTDIEIPGDEAKATSQGLIVETSQTGKTECNDQFDDELASKQSDVSTEPYVMMEPVSCASHAEMHDSHIGKDRIEVKETSESMKLILRKDECDSQTINLSKEKYGFENKSIQQLESSGSHKRAKDDFTAVFSEEPRNDISKINVVPIQVDSVEIMTNNVVDKSAQEQDSQDVEKDHGMVTCVKVSERNQRKLGVSGLKEPERSSEKVDLTVQTQDLVITKHIAPSDRCLRSRGLTANVNIKRECDAELIDLKMKDPNDALLIKQPTNPMEINVPSEAECDFKVSENLETGSKQSLADHHTHKNVDKDESPFLGLQNNSEDFPKETISITPTAKKGRSQEMDNPNTRKMSLRNRSQNLEMELSVDKDNTSPMKRSPPSLKSMFLRSRSKCEPPVSSESSSLIPAGNSEKQDLLSSRRSSCVSEQTKKHLHDLSSSSVMPSRSKSSSATKLTRCSPGKSPIKLTNSSSLICEQPTNPPASAPSIKLESSGYMPLRSSIAEQLAYNKSAVEDASVSPGRMSLRQGNLSVSEKPCGSATSFKRSNRHPQRQQRALMSSGVERSPLASKIKTEKNTKDCFSLSDELLCIAGHQRTEPVVCGPPQFLEVLRGEEHQQLILNLNTKFEKMHKGWVQMDKETQPAPKPKNKADRLKEIWKSKRRTRKSRPVEQQKFSPVQMLFMKPYDLPSICRWFLQSTETKSLVIVKKVNTRLPSETQLCFHTSSTSTGSSNGIFPSLQAERLKKHLKKFAIASPVKNNPKNQRLISKALGQDISVFRSKPEPKTATRISTKAQSLAGLTPLKAPQNHCPVTGSSKNPASARIIKKYSNIREKLQVQQSKKHEEKTFRVTRLKTEIITSKAAKPKLITHNNSKSAIVQNIKSMTKKAKKPAVTKRTLKKNLHRTYGTSPKRLQDLTENASTNALIKKENIKTCEKPYQTKASGIKVDTQRSVLNKCSNSSESLSQYIDTKPLSLEDQVLTRSQRKLECKPSHIRHPKCSTKRGVEQLVTPNKRKRTSKP